MDEVEAVTLLLEKEHCLEKGGGTIVVFQTDSWTFYKDGEYVGGRPNDDGSPPVEGAEQHSFLVHWLIADESLTENTPRESRLTEVAFKTAKEAAKFYVSKCRELGF